MARVRIYYSTFIEVDVDENVYPTREDIVEYVNENSYELLDCVDSDEIYANISPQYGEIDIIMSNEQ